MKYQKLVFEYGRLGQKKSVKQRLHQYSSEESDDIGKYLYMSAYTCLHAVVPINVMATAR